MWELRKGTGNRQNKGAMFLCTSELTCELSPEPCHTSHTFHLTSLSDYLWDPCPRVGERAGARDLGPKHTELT